MSTSASSGFDFDELRKMMYNQRNIRNVALIGHVKHGKTTLTDYLIEAAVGLQTARTYEGVGFKANTISLSYQISPDFFKTNQGEHLDNAYLINIVDSPGHADFSCEVTAALRVTDGALVVVDCKEGICLQTENVIRMALEEKIIPVLILNKVDTLFYLDGEDVYQIFQRVIKTANDIIDEYQDPQLGDCRFSPEKGTVAFSVGLDGWAFTLQMFAKVYEHEIERFWGDHFFDRTTNEWTSESTGSETCKRGFVEFCWEPIQQFMLECMSDDKSNLWQMVENFGITIRLEDKSLGGMLLMNQIMKNWLPASRALLEMIIQHLPSPFKAQQYRVEKLYDGPPNDPYAEAIRNCDPEGPLMVYVSKLIPQKGSFCALGRIFSGKIAKGLKVQTVGPNYVPGERKDLYADSDEIQRITILYMGKNIEMIGETPCGNIVELSGIDKFCATVTAAKNTDAHPIRALKFSVSPIVCITVQCLDASDRETFVKGIDSLAKFDPMVFCSIEESGGYTIAGVGEFHLQICLNYLRDFTYGKVPFIQSELYASLREIVVAESRGMIMCDSPDGQNRLYMQARPMEEGLLKAIDDVRLVTKDDPKVLSEILIREYNWDEEQNGKIWAFGQIAPNMIVNKYKGVESLDEIKDMVVAGFQEVLMKGPLVGEPMREICFEVCEAFRRGDLIEYEEMVRKAVRRSAFSATPRIMEPLFLMELLVPVAYVNNLPAILKPRSGTIVDSKEIPLVSLHNVKVKLPVNESFMFAESLKTSSLGKIFPQCVCYGWEVQGSDPFVLGTEAAYKVRKIRNNKGMKELYEEGYTMPMES